MLDTFHDDLKEAHLGFYKATEEQNPEKSLEIAEKGAIKAILIDLTLKEEKNKEKALQDMRKALGLN